MKRSERKAFFIPPKPDPVGGTPIGKKRKSVACSAEEIERRKPINHINRKGKEMDIGYISEFSAAGFVKRICLHRKPKGGESVQWLWDFDENGNECCTGEYLVKSTGEIKERKEKSEFRIDNERTFAKTCERFKWKLRANAHRAKLFVTLTYAENMTDTERLYDDFRKFWQKFRRKYGSDSKYLVAFEPQTRGAWHAHIVCCDCPAYIPNGEIAEMWGHGFTKTERAGNIDDIGNYLIAYLVKLDGKKNMRLHLYPAGFHFLRYSKGLCEAETRKYYGGIEKFSDGEKYEKLYDYSRRFTTESGMEISLRVAEWREKEINLTNVEISSRQKEKKSKKIEKSVPLPEKKSYIYSCNGSDCPLKSKENEKNKSEVFTKYALSDKGGKE